MIEKKLLRIQTELKAPKNQFNMFGKYKYRSCEDILESVKPLCAKERTLLLITDGLLQVGDRYYVQAVVTLTDIDSKEVLTVTAYAREATTKKGMDESQITGATSSYARKCALGGMFLIDDNKDADTKDNTDKTSENGYINDKQLGQLRDMMADKNVQEAKFSIFLKVDSLDMLPKTQFNQAFQALKSKKVNNGKPTNMKEKE
ncbi:MAG: ERF family protein [Nanoarchaeota archaeon]|nr:ERF family protein [Nanoarchaeota archaeon]